MLVKCHLPNKEDPFIIYDSESLENLNLKDLNIIVDSELTQIDPTLPIYPLNDILLTHFKRKTDTSKLESLNLITFLDLEAEYNRIQLKKSKFSRSERDLITSRYLEIQNVIRS